MCCARVLDRKIWLLTWLVVVVGCWQMSNVAAQGRRRSGGDAEEVSLTTKDGVQLKADFYPSSMGKDAVPIVMLHDFKENRKVFSALARALQTPAGDEQPSHAVLTVDLRGHGESTTQTAPNGQSRELETDRLGKNDFRDMVSFDMEAVRKFLVTKNDAGQLNLNKLTLLGSGLGANVATAWSAVDWSTPKLANRKQGQDLKGLILISPEWGHRGLPMLKPLRHPGVREKISMLIIYGEEDRRSSKDASTINKNLERWHPLPPPEDRREKQDLVVLGLPTALKGTRLVTDADFGMLPDIERFLNYRLTKQDFEWIRRRACVNLTRGTPAMPPSEKISKSAKS